MEEERAALADSNYEKDYAERLLNRQADKSYVSMWQELLKRIKTPPSQTLESSLLLFRLGVEWLGIPTKMVEEVIDLRTIHTVPSTRSKIFLGVVNVRGQLRLCVALHRLLDIQSTAEEKVPEIHIKGLARRYRRMLAIRRGVEVWVFPVDEIYGVVTCDFDNLDNIPVTVAKSTSNYLLGIFAWKDHSIGILDGELLFESLRRLVP